MRSCSLSRSRLSLGRRIVISLAFGLSSSFCITPSHADDFEWSVPLDGFFISAGPWTRLTGTSSAPPGSGDRAIFNEPGTYTATFTNNRTTELLDVTDGEVTFRSSGTDRTYTLSEDVNLEGGDLILGVAGDPLHLDVNDVLRVRDGSRLDIEHGSDVNVDGQLRVGADTAGDGTVIVNNSTLTTAATNNTVVGGSGSMGSMQWVNFATGTIGSNLHVATSAVSGSSGSVSVSTSSKVTIDGDLNMTTGSNTNQTAFFFVDTEGTATLNGNLNIGTGTSTSQSAFFVVSGAGSTFSQTGAGKIDIGGAAAAGNFARLDVNGGGFSSGSGQISVHETGVLYTAGGKFTANGPVVINNGGSFVVEVGEFEAKAGLDNSAGGAIDFRDGMLTLSGGASHLIQGPSTTERLLITGTAVDDLPTLVVKSGATLTVPPGIRLGANGTSGALEVSSGGQLSTTVGFVRMGHMEDSLGTALVTGEGSVWNGNNIYVGSSGTAQIDVLDGGTLDASSIRVGESVSLGSPGDGRIDIRGDSSMLSVNSLAVGNRADGVVILEDGLLDASTIYIGAGLNPGPDGDGKIFVQSGGTLNVSSNIYVGGDFSEAYGSGLLQFLSGGTAEIDGVLRVWDEGRVSLGSNTFLAADEIELMSPTSQFVVNGTLQVSTFTGSLEQIGGSLAPGPNAGGTTVLGDYTLSDSDATLDIEIGGTSPGGSHDFVNVSGDVFLDGELLLTLIDSFLPDANDELLILASNSILGFFDNVATGQRLEVAGGEGSFIVNYGIGSAYPSNQIVLSDFLPTTSPVDADMDGDVDGLDFLLLQRGNPALIPQWQTEYGNAPLSTVATVPEPTTLALLTCLGCLISLRPHGPRH